MYKGDNKSYERSVLYKYIYLALCLDFYAFTCFINGINNPNTLVLRSK